MSRLWAARDGEEVDRQAAQLFRRIITLCLWVLAPSVWRLHVRRIVAQSLALAFSCAGALGFGSMRARSRAVVLRRLRAWGRVSRARSRLCAGYFQP